MVEVEEDRWKQKGRTWFVRSCPVSYSVAQRTDEKLLERPGREHGRGFWRVTLEALCWCEELSMQQLRSHRMAAC